MGKEGVTTTSSDPRSPVNDRAFSGASSTRNHLLAALPRAEFDRIAPTLDTIPLTLKDILHRPGERIHHVYFPGGGFCSMVTVLADGAMVEIATVGREGMLGVSAMWEGSAVTATTMVQGETDTCYRMPVDAFRREFDRRGRFAQLLTTFSQALFGSVAQSTACNAVHTVEQRLARWLLMAADRMESHDFPLTQEFAAMMLGRRARRSPWWRAPYKRPG